MHGCLTSLSTGWGHQANCGTDERDRGAELRQPELGALPVLKGTQATVFLFRYYGKAKRLGNDGFTQVPKKGGGRVGTPHCTEQTLRSRSMADREQGE